MMVGGDGPNIASFEAAVPNERCIGGHWQVLSHRPIDAPGYGLVCVTASWRKQESQARAKQERDGRRRPRMVRLAHRPGDAAVPPGVARLLSAWEVVAQRGSVRGCREDSGMPQNFIEGGREQGFLLPPDVRDWLPGDHLAWFVVEAVKEMDLSAFYGAYRADGHGRAAYEPSVMVTLVLYAFATKVRSSRAIECHCRQDVAYRVITGNAVPDHATVARFICRHELALADLFSEVLRLCDEAGLVKPGLIAVDGTRMAGNASPEANLNFEQIAREMLAEHRANDQAEDEQYGEARGDELPEQLRTPEGRREFLREARQKQRGDVCSDAEPEDSPEGASPEPGFEFDAERIVARVQGREGWLREARRQLEEHRWEDPEPIARSREERLSAAAGRLGAFCGAVRE